MKFTLAVIATYLIAGVYAVWRLCRAAALGDVLDPRDQTDWR